ncbi:hypothetical protein LX32DRAFT_640257 [Colletotrichum zoysiae]|uniref:Flavin-nucleotide-binding protein n=1 Tax=Colletotrichum zoysiae TaxID=1216348 RepID=A0AAD9M4C6_9PEZI|nr:hypothetical protein LX32DRAFT_640257 [Colletotrichum zoysiae]
MEYPKTALNTVKRYRNRGVYDYETINNIIDQTPVLHVSFAPGAGGGPDADPYPVVLPMMGFTGDFHNPDGGPDEPRAVYLHGYVSSRMMRTAAAADGCADQTEAEGQGMPVCVAATLFDGVVLALTPNHHSCNYRSAVVFGRAVVVADEAERLWAMERVTDNLVPGRWSATRYPNSAEQRATGILRVEIDRASAKVRTGSTGEDRHDLQDLDMRRRVWAGVVPAYLVWGAPVPAETNMMERTPAYIEAWRTRETDQARAYAERAAKND